jgi:hypothetical protein
MVVGRARASARLPAAAAALALASALVVFAGPADSAACAGVTAVVDYGILGGGVQERCVTDGAGRSAWEVFEEAGFPLTSVQQYPGAVCRVSGKPDSDPCVRMPPANAYWGLFWSSGSGWVYSSKGATALTMSAGDSVGLAWQNSTAQRKPGAAAAAPAPTPKPTPKPRPKPSPKPSATSVTTKPEASAKPAGAPTATGTSAAAQAPTSTAAASDTASVTPTAPPASSGPAAVSPPTVSAKVEDSDGGGLPWWLPVGSIAVLAGAGGIVWQVRRTRP